MDDATLAYFENKLRHETDSSDVYAAQRAGEPFVLVDVRGHAAWRQGRIRGAIHIPHREIPARASQEIPGGTRIVVYCWSPGCNAGAKAAVAFARLGYDVKEMIGGFEYWAREALPLENDEGPLPRGCFSGAAAQAGTPTGDPLVMAVSES